MYTETKRSIPGRRNTKTKMSKEEIIKSLKDILDEINETPKDSFVDITYIKETLEDILNQNKDDE